MEKRSEDFKKVYKMLETVFKRHLESLTMEDQIHILTSMQLIEDFIVPDSKDLH